MAELTLVEQSFALNQPGKLNTADGSVDCEVLSLSRKGAQVRLDGALEESDKLFLAIREFGQLSCRIEELEGDTAELRFQGDPETQEAVFQEILAQFGDDEGRRRYLRRSVLWPGSLQGAQGEMDCTILNMSLGGAKVALGDTRDCSGHVTLFGDRFEGLSAIVMWQRGRLIGLQFKDAPAEVARILGDLLPAIRASA
jgi:PilZ domain